MTIERLRDTLRELHEQLESNERLDPESRALLERTVEEIRITLARAEPTRSREDAEGLAGRLEEVLAQFEAEHPELVRLVGRVADALGNVGI